MLGLGNNLATSSYVGFSNTYSLDFDGTDDYVTMGDPVDGSLDFSTGDFTITLWFKVSSDASQYAAIYTKDTSKFRTYLQDVTPGSRKLTTSVGGTSKYNWFEYEFDTWYHLAVNRSSGTVEGYIDGVSKFTTTMSGDCSSTTSFDIGGIGSASNLSGNIDEVAIWDTALSAGDISALYSAKGTANLNDDGNSANLQGWWRMGDGDTYPTITDNSTNSNDGTMTNMASDDIVKDTP